MASSLKLQLERVISVNRLSNALELPLERKLGELDRARGLYIVKQSCWQSCFMTYPLRLPVQGPLR